MPVMYMSTPELLLIHFQNEDLAMRGITIKQHGDFSNFQKFYNRITNKNYLNVLEQYGKAGVQALSSATPKDTGVTASSWTYEISHNMQNTTISWTNANENNGVNIAILLQYGHGTGWGGYVKGRDYINPAMQPIFDRMANELWKEVTE